MTTFEILKNFFIAIVLGGLIGLQREHNKAENKMQSFAGVRTFILVALLGALATFISVDNQLVFLLLLGGYVILTIVAYFMEATSSKRIGATTELSGILVFLIGGLAMKGETDLAVILAIIIVLILALKGVLHRFAQNLKEEEIFSTLKFAIIAFIVLPLLPDKTFGPLDVLNPHNIWLMVVLISGMSFVAYILIKALGAKKGIALTGILGGFISSTAITTSLSNESKRLRSIVNPFVFGIVVACSTMFIRVLVEVFVINKNLLPAIILPMLVMGAVGFISAVVIYFKKDDQKGVGKTVVIHSPFMLSPALKFGLFFGIILFATKAASIYLSSSWTYLTSIISGLVDVDAITVSMANLAKTGDISDTVAATAIIIGAATNTAVKAGIAYFLASKEVGKKILLIFGAMLLAGIVAVLVF